MKLLDSCYDKCLNGVPKVSQSVEDMAEDYLKKYQKEHPDTPLVHNEGNLKGQIIEARTY